MQPVLFNNNLLRVSRYSSCIKAKTFDEFPGENLLLLVTVGDSYYYDCVYPGTGRPFSFSSELNNVIIIDSEHNSKHKLTLHFLKLFTLYEIPLV